ncbi:putative pentatricopeptide repeat-containing protein [Hibiscus syriacus]|uniref:Pentatricopeptide repeat-containing protein n=1 Tax=Hibiscus syriacus TaxID=106335 RepID=A0A6A2Y3Q7_HIBSY|nr:putative pentatricopeptide repeat-containing protein [Hibiscus syriacus]
MRKSKLGTGNPKGGVRYPPNPYGVSHRQGYGSFNRQKLIVRNFPFSRPIRSQYVDDDEDVDDEEEDLGEEEENLNRVKGVGYAGKGVDDNDDYDNEDDDYDDDLMDDDDNDYNEGGDLERHPKKRKLKSLVSSYEFSPRVRAPAAVAAPSVLKPSYGGRNSLTNWTGHETFVLLDAWEISKIERTETQCRNRLDTLKKKYKKEKAMLVDTGATTSKWVYFKKMDMLMSSPPQQGQLSCGFDSGEYVFMNPRAYLNRENCLDEMRVSPANSESSDEEDVSDGLPPKKRRFGWQSGEGSSVRLLADSIKKFSDIYEKIENNKRQQMLELEKMRTDFHTELEMQKRQIMERTQAEIAKMQCGDDEANDVSSENASGN